MVNLIAGPIVRRVTEFRICVWLALAEEAPLKLTIFNAQDGQIVGASDPAELDESRCRLGQNLVVYLLQARPIQETFPADTLFHYRIDALENGEEIPVDLAALGLTYDGQEHPSFFLPNSLRHLLYGSCRKPHGMEAFFQSNPQARVSDGLSHGDDELARTYADLNQRPALLILGGDQIYADDVAVSILEMLKPEAVKLIGHAENIPGLPITPAMIPPGRRKQSAKIAEYSSEEADNHLLSFGEFAAMYIYAFGNAPGWTPTLNLEKNDARKSAVDRFHATLPKVRRLLANVATYMIFDDHDVTDDWNITAAWYDRVRDSATGRRVTGNALAAYWAFQAWGNQPDNFDWSLRWVIEGFVGNMNPAQDMADSFDLQVWKYRGWGFSIPTDPPIIALDSRTQRQPDNDYNPPRLLDRYALDWLRVEWLKLKTRPGGVKGQPVFVATTPVMGFAPVELIQELSLRLIGWIESYRYVRIFEKLIGKEGFLEEKVIEKLDAEAWTSNSAGFVDFLRALIERMGIRNCVFLSGDVHYSFSAESDFQKGKGPLLHCKQLTSSALCNAPNQDSQRALAKMEKLKGGKSEHSAPPLWPWKRWKVTTRMLPATQNGNPAAPISTSCNLGLVEFDANGEAVLHTLLCGTGGNVAYRLTN